MRSDDFQPLTAAARLDRPSLRALACAAALVSAGCQHGGPKDAGPAADAAVDPVATTETASEGSPTGPVAAEPRQPSFEAVLRIDAEPGYKHFQGVWLEVEGGERWVIDYRARPWWRPFEDQRVAVQGRFWRPEGQAIGARHFEVSTLTPVEPPVATPRSLGPEQVLRGHFELYTWPEGTKLEGETATVFASEGGGQYWLAGAPSDLPKPGETVDLRAREVEPSPYVSRPGGRYLWPIAVRRDPSRPGWSGLDYGP